MAYFESTSLKDANGNLINPAEKQVLYYTTDPDPLAGAPAIRLMQGSLDDQLVLLRRMIKILESQAAVDPQQRQRITIDAITGSLTLGTVSTVSTVSTVTNIAALNGWNQQMFADPARNAYNTGIRSQLTFT